MYKIPFYMESELEQMQAAAPTGEQQQQQQPPAGQPGAVKVTNARRYTSKYIQKHAIYIYSSRSQRNMLSYLECAIILGV